MNFAKKQKTVNLLTICIKAGKTVRGFDSAKDAVTGGNAYCILTTSDISPKTLKEMRFICEKNNVKLFETELTKSETESIFGKQTAVIAVCDKGFADGFLKIISDNTDKC